MQLIRRTALVAFVAAVTVGGGTAVYATSSTTSAASQQQQAASTFNACAAASQPSIDEMPSSPVTAKVSCSYGTEPAPGGGVGSAATASAGAEICVAGACSGTGAPVTVGSTGAGVQPAQVGGTRPSLGQPLVPGVQILGGDQVCVGNICNDPVSTPAVPNVDSSTTVFSGESITQVAANGSMVIVRGPQTCVATGSQTCTNSGTGTDTAAGSFRSDTSQVVEVQ